MIKYARLFFSVLSPSSFWFLKVEACYFTLTEDLALFAGYRRASLINFHYWLEMKKPRIFLLLSFFKHPPTILLGISPVEMKNLSTPSFLFPCALAEKWFVLWRQWNFTNNISMEKKITVCCRAGCCHSSLQPAISNDRNKTNFTCEHNCITINLHANVLK